MQLWTLPVLLVDCQTTGATPAHGALLEIAWSATCAAEALAPIAATLVALPDGADIPPAVRRLTGIEPPMLVSAPAPGEVARRLIDATGERALLAHFARFERPFLATLLGAPPEPLLCTHEIARRLLPDLPRRSLRALAGYFGRSLAEEKRAADHVRGTAVVWRGLVERLAAAGVDTLPELTAWLAAPAPRAGGPRHFPLPRARRLALPDAPGVYRLHGGDGRVLYVGKATSLRDRVNSYFRGRRGHAERTLELVSQVHAVEVTVTPSALEAALLETDEIKRHAPPYNQRLRARDRGVAFATRSLDALAAAPDAAHPVGPLPAGPGPLRLGALAAGAADPFGFASLDAETRAAGLALFRARHGLDEPPRLAPLLALGRALWRADDEAEAEGDADEAPEPAAGWTPERVAGAAERLVTLVARDVRRAAWLARLTDATVRWRGRDGAPRTLHFAGGRPAPRPPAARRPRLARLADFDLATFDRLATLAAEIRRLAREGRLDAVTTGFEGLDGAAVLATARSH